MMLRRGPWPWRARLLPTPGTQGHAHPRPPMPQVLCVKLCGNLKFYQSNLYSTLVPSDEITVSYKHGLPLITLTLPSRKERCQFVVKPMLSTVGSFLQDLQNEDKGIRTAAIFTADGTEIAASTLMEILLKNDFKLVIDKITYDVQCPMKENLSSEQATEMENMKSLVYRLFTALHLEEFQKKREHHLLEKIDHLKGQLQPLEQMKARIEARSEAKISGLLWAGLAMLSVQGGAMAWLTWWVYSWDIMEPVTYFITFANSMVFFAYFIVTRQDYTYSAVKSRQFLHFFHKRSKQQHFDVEQYNKLKDDLAKAPLTSLLLLLLLNRFSPTLCDPMDSSPPGSSVHGILQARTLQWAAMSFIATSLNYHAPPVLRFVCFYLVLIRSLNTSKYRKG
uniref:Calcium uniporter protein n=1 Tax=Bos indicus x Bos taurus TaxID=30522 RepID=A0A4W2DN18_BOBOX